jgi:4-amino-4-deoxy-L-arabinose transferase-like glycosyltransferase
VFLKRLILVLLVLVALAAAYLWLALNWSYSSGERAGWVQKLSDKGWVCKTWEGELALVSLPGSSPEKFAFTIRDDAVAAQVTKVMGKRVSLHYEQKVGLPTSCFGETRYYVTGVTLSDEIPLAAGVMVPNPPAPASAASR